MIVKEIDYVKSSTALQPKRKSREEDRKKYDELRKARRNREKRKREQENKYKKAAIQAIILISVIGMFTLFRDSIVYNKQKELADINSQISEVKSQNEALRINLLKNEGIDNVKTNAEAKLGMTLATKDKFVEVDLTNNYFEELDAMEKANRNSEEKGIISKIKDALD